MGVIYPPIPNMRSLIVGLDVSASWADAVWLDAMPAVPLRDFYQSPEFPTIHRRLPATADSIRFVKSLEPAAVVMEPTGSYSRFWRDSLHREGIPTLLVDQTAVRDTRRSFGGTSNKSDPYDALIMLAIYFRHYAETFDRRYWVRERSPEVEAIERALADIAAICKRRTAVINQAKARLTYEFPRKARVDSKRDAGTLDPDKLPSWWAWACGWVEQGDWKLAQTWQTRYDNEYEKAMAAGEGTGISPLTARLAQQICSWHQAEAMVELDLLANLAAPEFEPYHKAFDRFGFGSRERAALLTRVYPFEQFRGVPKSKALRRFRQACGLGAIQIQSGQTDGRSRFKGSKLGRTTLHQFVIRAYEKGLNEAQPTVGTVATTDKDCMKRSPENLKLRAAWMERAYEKGRKVRGNALKDARNAISRKLAEALFKVLWEVI